jgi:hypothetical protein
VQAFTTLLSGTSGTLNANWNDYTAFGNVFGTRTLEVRIYNDSQWTGGATPKLTDAYDVAGTLTLDPQAVTLTPVSASITHLQSAQFTYNGPAGWLACAFVNSVLDPTSCGAVENFTAPNSIAWATYGSTVDKTVTVRVYAQPATSPVGVIDATTTYAATADVTFVGYIVPAITAPVFNPMQVGVPFDQTITLGDKSVGFNWATGVLASVANLPAGLRYTVSTDLAGAPVLRVFGTPTTAGPMTVTIAAGDGVGASATVDVTVTVAPAATLASPTVNALQSGVPFDQSIALAGYSTGFDWTTGSSATVTGLPAGLQYTVSTDVAGAPVVRIFGTPSVPGSASIGFTANDGRGATASATTTVTVSAAATLSAPTLPNLRVGTPASTQIDLTALASGFDWTTGASLSLTGLPSGVTYGLANPSVADPLISAAGQAPVFRFGGTPTAAGSYTVTITVTDSRGATATTTAPLTVVDATVLAVPTIGSLQVGVSFSQTITVAANAAGWNWHAGGTSTITGLPAGLTYSVTNAGPNGWTTNGVIPQIAITGIPTVAGSGSFSWTVTDADGGTATVSVPYVVNPGIAPVDPPARTLARPGRVNFAITGIGAGATVVAGPLVAGVQTVTITGNIVNVQTKANFSGLIDQTIVSTYYGVSTTVHLRVTVNVVPVTNATFSRLTRSSTIVRWTSSPNAYSYVITVGARTCFATTAQTSCTVPVASTSTTVVTIRALGGNGLSATTRARFR